MIVSALTEALAPWIQRGHAHYGIVTMHRKKTRVCIADSASTLCNGASSATRRSSANLETLIAGLFDFTEKFQISVRMSNVTFAVPLESRGVITAIAKTVTLKN